ncbi:multi antimicrobial extrusion protein MatE [Xylanibacillus composti]|uniref:Multi antimicrobial extrusion protein MatE n=1 Tax=Xylanibacillus composti TaxID=1572762 RepID=A0A8J4GZP0_9BACL|nr:multi antimicrobial extrusion protein MatE [Xylanibacillus composti]MDT9724952.1 multi antimicrobial extrusion protein MatE [Xylanibacillus composti]GIQ68192.1 multi antimicrobial extrusion protein MatE [Xylanibacillus composti]
MDVERTTTVTAGRMAAFFLPLGISASLVTISHVIINGTLARAENPAPIIAAYAIALSFMAIIEKPAVLLRQTCSALVRDKVSFRAMSKVTFGTLAILMLIGAIAAFTPIGGLIFRHVFGVEEQLIGATVDAFRILMFVTLFSGIRCLYHGIIISNMRTKWLTIGMIVRLAAMFLLAQLLLMNDLVRTGQAGAIIFLAGMAIEAAVAFWEGRTLANKLPNRLEEHPVTNTKPILQFYRPFVLSAFISVLVGPAVNIMLGKTVDFTLAVASFALAMSLMHLVNSFFSYVHQLVLNFFQANAALVKRFVAVLSLIPALLLALLGFTSFGNWIVEAMLGAKGELLDGTIQALRVFIILSLAFPWLDYMNGRLMLAGQTRAMVWSQSANIVTTITLLVVLVALFPSWNAMIGAAGQSLGVVAELAVAAYVVRRNERMPRFSRDHRQAQRKQIES